ncbi:spore coat protein [Halobacillus fulvus]|nr:spore coat protein [Halobacillus fulvus]
MSCSSSKKHDDKCVRDVVKEIIAAQDQVANDCCDVSCGRSVRELLSPTATNGNTTVPFILYCKSCKPFIGSGVIRQREGQGQSNNTFLRCLETPIFKAKKFVDGSKNCVKLELLLPVNMGGNTPGSGGDEVCDFFPGNGGGPIRNLMSTGVCITVDLDCFCGISCLEPTTPLPFSMPEED